MPISTPEPNRCAASASWLAAPMSWLAVADQPVEGIADLARQDDVLREQALRLGDDGELLLAHREDAVRSVHEAAKLLDPLEQARPELGVELARQRFERGQRAAQRKGEQRQVGGALGVGAPWSASR